MALYEFWCATCNEEFEVMRPMSKMAEPAGCPTCGGQGGRLPSVFASKADYSLHLPAGDAFRGRKSEAAAES